MQLFLENIGLIKQANINLRGITIIAGENDAGKSTIGKIFFSLIKADNIAEHKLDQYMHNQRVNILEKIRKKLLRKKPFLALKIPEDITTFYQLEKLKAEISDFPKFVKSELENLKILLDYKKAYKFRRNYEFSKQIRFNFGSVDSLISKDSEGKIQLLASDGTKLYEVIIKNIGNDNANTIFRDFLPERDNKKSKPFRDVTLISTPVVIDLVEFFYSLVLQSGRSLKFPYPFIMRDLVRKLLREKKENLEINKIINKIKETINGEIVLDKEEILFKKGDRSFKMLGTATGIKSFAILLRLLEANVIAYDTVLIIDEPEVHLHPKWQIKYAKILVDIHKNLGTLILITTHSPYIVQALRYFTESLSQNVDFYLADKGNFKNVNNNIGFIFEKLGEPLWDVI